MDNKELEAFEWLDRNNLGYTIWNNKYRHNNESFDEWLDRVSGGDSAVRRLILEKKFLFGGRILSNRGVNDKKITYSNCFVITPPEDNLESIFECAKKAARTFSYGGGVGIQVSNLAPKGAKINNAAKSTSGTTSFMELYSQVTGLIGQDGRRGALMLCIKDTHPDLIDFINLKSDLNKCTNANISVLVSNDFMKAVRDDTDWELLFNRPESNECITTTVKAREVFKLLCKRNWEMAEPGIIYWDTVNSYNLLNTNKEFKYQGLNPCAEEPLPAGGSCLLGSINVSEFIESPFTNNATINTEELQKAAIIATKALNSVLMEGMSLLPLEEQRTTVNDWRQIGLGIFGLADAFIKLGVKYGEYDSINAAQIMMQNIAVGAIKGSIEVAKVQGSYPKFNSEEVLRSSFMRFIVEDTNFDLTDYYKYGLANSQLLTCPPTGSTANLIGCSNGVEPNFAFEYKRRTMQLTGKEEIFTVKAGIVNKYIRITGNEILPDYFVSAEDIDPIDRIKMQSMIQNYIDASISSTINLPESATIQDVYNIYMQAWLHDLKGVTIYRNNCSRQGILSNANTKTITNTSAPKRPKVLDAIYYQVVVKGEQFIVLIGLLDNKPYEVFAFRPKGKVNLNTHKGTITKYKKGHYTFNSDDIQISDLQLANEDIEEKAATLYTSMLLRHGVDIKFIIKVAKKVNDNITSFSSAMCRILSKYVEDEEIDEKCPECGEKLIREGGCRVCHSCGYSRCE